MAAPISLEGEIWADRRSGSASMWSLGETVFSRSSTLRREQDDEEALKWAALEKLPTYDRLRTAILRNVGDNGKGSYEEIDVTKLGYEDRQHIIEKILKITEEDNERFLLKLRDRIDRYSSECAPCFTGRSRVTCRGCKSSLAFALICNLDTCCYLCRKLQYRSDVIL